MVAATASEAWPTNRIKWLNIKIYLYFWPHAKGISFGALKMLHTHIPYLIVIEKVFGMVVASKRNLNNDIHVPDFKNQRAYIPLNIYWQTF